MSEDVKVELTENNAVLLLAAAEELGLGPGVVKTIDGAFLVPQEVNDRAFRPPDPEPEKPAKKTATKRAAKKK